MSADEFNHFESYEWLGLFSYPDKSIDFPGKLTYTPDRGLQLEFMCQMDSHAKKVGHLHGVLSTGKLCTLVGNFDPPSCGMSIGIVSMYRGKPRFDYAIFGAHADPSDKFRGILLDFPNFQEFFHPQGFQDSAEYSSEPLHVHSGDGLEVSVVNSGNFLPVFSNFANRFQSEDPEVLQEIEEFFAGLAKRHPAGKITSRVDMKWLLEIQATDGKTFQEFIKLIYLSFHLFSLLIFQPVRPLVVSMLVDSAKNPGKLESHDALISLYDLSAQRISVLKREVMNHTLPIKPSNIEIGEVFVNWFGMWEDYQLFIPRIANNFGSHHESALWADFILLLTQLEGIAQKLGKTKSADKYSYPIAHYDKVGIEKKLRKFLNLTNASDDIGAALSNLRGEIAHVAKAKKLLAKARPHFIVICRCLDVIIASHIYMELGIKEDVVKEFQKWRVNFLRSG